MKSKKTKVKYDSVLEELAGNFKPRKQESLKLAQSFKRLNNLKYYEKVKNCGTLCDFNSSGKLVNANFCKNRLCPMCNWRRSMKLGMNVSKIVEHLGDEYRFIFITLTVPNPTGDKLNETIDKLQKGWSTLMKDYANFRRSIKGYFRALEITYNRKRHDYHPHLHIICAVKPEYFDKSNKYYIDFNYLLESWRRVMNAPTITNVRIEVCRDKKTGLTGFEKWLKGKKTINIKSAVLEVAKYAVKPGDYLFKSYKLTDEVVSTLSPVLANRRLTTMGGVFRKIAALLKLDDSEDGDLTHIDDDSTSDKDDTVYRYVWKNDNYVLFRIFMPDGTVVDGTTGEIIDDTGG